MTKLVAVIAMVSMAGCYLGPKSTHKKVAYGVNAAAVVGGTALAIASGMRSGECADSESSDGSSGLCLNDGLAAVGVLTGVALAAVGVTGLVINATHSTEPDVVPGTAYRTTATVTAPGLRPAAVTLR
jgi:hypothetical protein